MKKEFGIGDNAAYKLSKEIALRGDLEELVASLSVLIAHLDNYMQIKIHCSEILKDLINIIDDLTSFTEFFDYRRVKLLESWIKSFDIKIDESRRFYPICTKVSSKALVCCTLARRCERNYLAYKEKDECIYLNRLGDYFYLLTRYINDQVGMEDYL